MRWTEINGEDFSIRHGGFHVQDIGGRTCLSSASNVRRWDIASLSEAEHEQRVIVHPGDRHVAFGRDYLGQHPLSFAAHGGRLVVSDDYGQVCQTVRQWGGSLTVSPEAVAMYFALGFVPQGMSLYREVVNCRAAGHYVWRGGPSVQWVDSFEPVAIQPRAALDGLADAMDAEVRRLATQASSIDVWCSGGLDSSIMAMLFNERERQADLLTLAYGQDIHRRFGDGERRYAQEVGAHVGAAVRDVDLDGAQFAAFHALFVERHDGPVMDFPLPPKYALTAASRDLAVTGEAGDTFFGGTKNAAVLFAHHQRPDLGLGLLYAMAHQRCLADFATLFKHGDALAAHVLSYCDTLVARYPGDLRRKLFYLNAHEKLSGMIFAQSYTPARLFGVRVRHPFASLQVYRQAFALPDDLKFSYPHSKIALQRLYGARLPPSILQRPKSGTQLPIAHYLGQLPAARRQLSALRATSLFREEFLDRLESPSGLQAITPLLAYACITLNAWIHQKERTHAHALSTQPGDHDRRNLLGTV